MRTVESFDTIEFSKERKEITLGLNDFALGLARIVRKSSDIEGGNYVISPFGLTTVIGMIANGADSLTVKEVLRGFGQNDSSTLSTLNYYISRLSRYLDDRSDDSRWYCRNSVWFDTSFCPEKNFVDTCMDVFNAEIFTRDLSEAKDEINDWTEENTAGMIKELLAFPIDDDETAMFINALYMKTIWQNKFDPMWTYPHEFKNQDGGIIECQMMRNSNKYLETIISDEPGFEMVRLPLDNGRLGMVIILPYDSVGIDVCLDTLTGDVFSEWLQKSYIEHWDTVKMPKFEIESRFILYPDDMVALGIDRINTEAVFDRMASAGPRYNAGPLAQKSRLIVKEEGVEGAVVTYSDVVISNVLGSPINPKNLTLDRPFLFAITEKKSGLILFIGELNTIR